MRRRVGGIEVEVSRPRKRIGEQACCGAEAPAHKPDCPNSGKMGAIPIRDAYPPVPAERELLAGPGIPRAQVATAMERPPSPLQRALAALFAREMDSRSLTQRDVADRLGLRSGLTGGNGVVSRLLRGKANPQLTDLERLLRLWGLRVAFVPCCPYHTSGGDVDNDCKGV